MNPRKGRRVRVLPGGRIGTIGLLILASCASGSGGRREATGEGAAFEAFRRGDFDQAEALGRGGTELDSRLLQARLHLLRNRPKESIEALYPLAAPYRPFTQLMPAKYDDIQVFSQVLLELGQAYVRADDFFNASRVYWALGDNILSRKYEALAKVVAYLPSDGWTETSLELEGVDPIPHVTMGVNGRPGVFLIDTSTDEIVIERDFAKRAGLTGLGYRTTNYNVAYDESSAERVTLGKLEVRNVPVHLGRLPAIAKVRADGAIGLAFLMHFDFTIDYRRSRLTLRRAGAAPAGGLPAVLAGDRHLLVLGSVNGRPGSWIAINTAMPDVVVAASSGMASQGGSLQEIAAGPLRLSRPPVDTDSFPTGLDGGFGFPAGFMLGHPALRDHSIRLEPRSMRIFIE
jgi:hypothetical protein